MAQYSTRYGRVMVKKADSVVSRHGSQEKVYFLNSELLFPNMERAPFLYLTTVVEKLFPILREANEVYEKHLHDRHLSRIYYVKPVYCSESTKRVQIQLNVVVMVWEGELHIRLHYFKRFRNSNPLGQSILTGWRSQYGSFRFDPSDVDSLTTCLMPRYTDETEELLSSAVDEWYI